MVSAHKDEGGEGMTEYKITYSVPMIAERLEYIAYDNDHMCACVDELRNIFQAYDIEVSEVE